MLNAGRNRRRRRLVERWLDGLHQHVSLVYPFASTDQALRQIFWRAAVERLPPEAPGERAWILGIARQVVYANHPDQNVLRRRNADAVALGLRDAVGALDDGARMSALRAIDGLTRLTPEEQELIRLHTVESLEPAELAWILGVDEFDAVELVDAVTAALGHAADHSASGSNGGDAGA